MWIKYAKFGGNAEYKLRNASKKSYVSRKFKSKLKRSLMLKNKT